MVNVLLAWHIDAIGDDLEIVKCAACGTKCKRRRSPEPRERAYVAAMPIACTLACAETLLVRPVATEAA